MAGRRDGQARDFGPGPSRESRGTLHEPRAIAANDNRPRSGPSSTSALPSDALAIIEPVPIAVNQAGRARANRWRLRFAERWRPRVDPLTGWTGGGDPLAQIELRFPDLEAAERYCRREGVPFERRGSPALRLGMRACLTGEAPPRLCCWPTGPHAMCCGITHDPSPQETSQQAPPEG
ncbi:MAG TPA: NADH dehydrogenase ubiquinone Fe-S protein 4 [Novosphingobium sp.]